MTLYRDELMLMALAIGLYLYDSALLLYQNEGVLVSRGRSWMLRLGSDYWLAGRRLFLPSPLRPDRPIFRLYWHCDRSLHTADLGWTSRLALFRPLVPMVWGMAVAVFLLLPIGLFSRLGDPMILGAICLLYLNIVAAISWLIYKRVEFGISKTRLAVLAFELLVCSPFAINVIRRISSGMRVTEDLVHAARRLQQPADWRVSRAQVASRIREQSLEADEDSESAALQDYCESLVQEEAAGACPQQKSS